MRVRWKTCFVPGCLNNTRLSPEKTFFYVPRDLQRRTLWVQAVEIDDPTDLHIASTWCCEDHFDLEDDSVNYIYAKLMNKRIRLKRDAIPHKNLPNTASRKNKLNARKKKTKKNRPPDNEVTDLDGFKIETEEIILPQVKTESEELNWVQSEVEGVTTCLKTEAEELGLNVEVENHEYPFKIECEDVDLGAFVKLETEDNSFEAEYAEATWEQPVQESILRRLLQR